MHKYILLLNGGVYYSSDGKNTFTEDELKAILQEAWDKKVKTVVLDNDIRVRTVNGLFKALQEPSDCCDVSGLSGLVEMGDDYASMMVVKVRE